MKNILDFIGAAAPWIVMGICVAVFAVKQSNPKKVPDYSSVGTALGLCFGAATGAACGNLAIGMCAGMTLGLLLGSRKKKAE